LVLAREITLRMMGQKEENVGKGYLFISEGGKPRGIKKQFPGILLSVWESI
jgi:hypothetical protein